MSNRCQNHQKQHAQRTCPVLQPRLTHSCHQQACKFRDDYQTFVDAGAAVFGISSDSPEANSQFASKRRLPFPLLTDEAGALRKVSIATCSHYSTSICPWLPEVDPQGLNGRQAADDA
jgi:hypothetical protein